MTPQTSPSVTPITPVTSQARPRPSRVYAKKYKLKRRATPIERIRRKFRKTLKDERYLNPKTFDVPKNLDPLMEATLKPGKRVRLKSNSKKRRTITLKDSEAWGDSIITQRKVPKGVKVEYSGKQPIPKKYRYQETPGRTYSHGTRHFNSLVKSGKISPSIKSQGGKAIYGDGVYLLNNNAGTNQYGDRVFEFPSQAVKAKLVKARGSGSNLGPVSEDTYYRYVGELPLAKATKVVVNDYRIPSQSKKVKIRYKKQIKNLINFSRQLNGKK